MIQETDYSTSLSRLKLSVLIGATISAVCATLLFVGAAFGSEFAMQSLINLSLPRFNVFANLIPADLHEVRRGTEMVLGVIIVQSTVVLSILIFAGWTMLRKR